MVVCGLVVVMGCASSDTELAASSTTSIAAVPDVVLPVTCAVAEPFDLSLDVDNLAFGTTSRVSVHFSPCAVDQPTPNAIIYLLHGAGADETQWSDVDMFGAADAAVLDGTMPPSVLVAPDVNAFTCKGCEADLLSHLIDEIEPAIERVAPIDTSRRAIGGISRGGAMALEVAGLAPDDFVAVGAHSPANAPEPALTAIAEAGLPVRFDVGHDDGLAGASEKMARFIQAADGSVELVVGQGRHDRAYWRSQAATYIRFYADHLR
jgi:enterochelin esterase-like enzyme